MTWRRFRNKIEKDMRTHQSPVDIDAIWANIEPDVDRINEEKKKKRRFIFFWWLLGITIVGFLAGLLLTKNSNELITKSSSTTETTVEKTTTPTTNTTEQSTTNNALTTDVNTLTENKTPTTANTAITNQNNTSNTINKSQNTTTSYSKQSNPTTKNQSTITNIQQPPYNNQQTIINSSTQQTTGAPVYNYNSPTQPAYGNTPYTAPKQPVTTQKPNQSTVISTDQSTINKQTTTAEQTTNSTTIKKGSTPSSTKAATDASNTKEIELVPVKEIQLIIPPFKPVTLHDSLMVIAKEYSNKQVESSPQKAFEFLIALEGGLGYAFQSLVITNDSTPPVDDSRRNDTETMLETTYAGIQIGAQHKSGLELLTGFSRTETTQRFDFADSIQRNFAVAHIDSIYLSVNGDTINSLTNYILTETTLYEKRIFNRYTFYDIPVSLGYHKQVGRNWRVGARAGVLINLALKTKGTIMTGPGDFADIKANQASYYKSKIGLNYTGEVVLGRRLGKNAWLTLSPFVRYAPKSLTVDSYEITHKQFLAGGKLGFQFRF